MLSLSDPASVGATVIQSLPPVPKTTLPRGFIPVIDNGDPLEPIADGIQVIPAYTADRWPGVNTTLCVRSEVNRRLKAAQALLPPGFVFAVLDAWRSATLQRALHDHYYMETSKLEQGYVSDPDSADLIPPHTTGGAVDITLAWMGVALRLGTDFDSFSPAAWATAFEDEPTREPERSLRRLLTYVLTKHGFCPYPKEWWHFSYGDQVWAYNVGEEAAIFETIDEPCH
jgi:D-alanyl-D-alanine dipeptidase